MANLFEKENEYCIYRPELNSFPAIYLPVFPRSLGYYDRKSGEEEIVPSGSKNFVQIFWSISGESQTSVDGEKFLVHPGDVFYRMPGEEHYFLTSRNGWRYRWITFDGPRAADFMRTYHYPRTPFHAGECPHDIFNSCRDLMLQRTPYCWRMMFAEICRILAAAGGTGAEPTPENSLVQQIILLCKERFMDPDLNVNALSSELNTGRGKLQSVFKQKMNQNLSDYLSQVRLQAALSLLRNSRRPLREIAVKCGFRDLNYFCRFIRKNTGRRPSELR